METYWNKIIVVNYPSVEDFPWKIKKKDIKLETMKNGWQGQPGQWVIPAYRTSITLDLCWLLYPE